MKKAPKGIKRKGYVYGTDPNGIQPTDEFGNPVQTTELDANGQPKKKIDTKQVANAAGQALGNFGTGYYATKQNESQGDSVRSAGLAAVGKTGAIGGAVAGIAAIGDQIGKPTKDASGKLDAQGNIIDPTKAKRNAIAGIMFSPSQRLTYEGGLTDVTGNAYISSLEKKKKDELIQAERESLGLAEQDALARREAGETGVVALNTYRPPMNKGGKVVGKGTGTSDSINAEVEEGSFVVPKQFAPLAKQIKQTLLKKKTGKADLHQKNGVPVKLSDGEMLLNPDEKEEVVDKLGEETLEALAPEAENTNEKAKGGDVENDPKGININKVYEENKTKDVAKKKKLLETANRMEADLKAGKASKYGKDYDSSILKYLKDQIGSVNKKYNLTDEVTTVTATPKKVTPVKSTSVKPTNNVSKNIFTPREYMNPIKTGFEQAETNDALKEIVNPNANAVDTNPVSTHTANKNNFWDKVGNIDTGGIGTNLMNYGLSAYQIQQGLKGLKASGKRPVYSIDPNFNKQVDTALVNQGFGFTAEQQALLDQQNQTALNAGRFAARNYSGGSGGNAFNMERNAINDAYTRSLQNAVANTEVQQNKRSEATNLLLNKTNISRQIFQDANQAFQDKQNASADTLNAGIGNAFSANRFANFMRLRNEENSFNNKYNP